MDVEDLLSEMESNPTDAGVHAKACKLLQQQFKGDPERWQRMDTTRIVTALSRAMNDQSTMPSCRQHSWHQFAQSAPTMPQTATCF